MPLRRSPGDIERHGTLVEIQSAENPQLGDSGKPRIYPLELIQSLFQGHDLFRPGARVLVLVAELNARQVATSFFRLLATRLINHDAAHDLGAIAQEMGAILETDILLGGKSQKRFMNQRRGAKRPLSAPAAQEMAPRQGMQFLVDHRKQLLTRFAVAGTGGVQ